LINLRPHAIPMLRIFVKQIYLPFTHKQPGQSESRSRSRALHGAHARYHRLVGDSDPKLIEIASATNIAYPD
jgi:hypothetical protein